jgi:hypothetical protein
MFFSSCDFVVDATVLAIALFNWFFRIPRHLLKRNSEQNWSIQKKDFLEICSQPVESPVWPDQAPSFQSVDIW